MVVKLVVCHPGSIHAICHEEKQYHSVVKVHAVIVVVIKKMEGQ
jgi:hypothetical protein